MCQEIVFHIDSRMADVGHSGLDCARRAGEILQQIDVVKALRDGNAASAPFLATPSVGCVVLLRSEPLHIRIRVKGFSKSPGINRSLHGLNSIPDSTLHKTTEFDIRTSAGLDHFIRFLQAHGRRLFRENMLACFCGLEHGIPVKVIRRCHADNIHIPVSKHLLE
jgi:hypothetical protein